MAGGAWFGRGGRRALAVVGAATLALLTACSGGQGDADTDTGGASHQAKGPTPDATVTVEPAGDASDVSPVDPVVVTAEDGTLTSVTVTNPDGKVVSGELSADKLTWTSNEPLGYSKTYSVDAVAANVEGKPTEVTSQFTTVTPANFTLPYLNAEGTYGVGMPVTVHFDEKIPDRAAAERTLHVTTDPPVTGSWFWMDDQNVHWRPQHYWATGTTVTVKADVYGKNFGEGLYGQEDVSTTFHIGDAKIATIDDNTHMMSVTINGEKAHADIPVSMGRGGSVTTSTGNVIDFTTMSGPHVVTEKFEVRHMSSATYGLPEDDPLGYSEDLPLAVRISNSGEFVHANPATVAQQGHVNVSHGCVNISMQNAQWFYSEFGRGDVVDIKNTGKELPVWDGLGDWVLSWDEWKAGSALNS